jgi:hypothetical protein
VSLGDRPLPPYTPYLNAYHPFYSGAPPEPTATGELLFEHENGGATVWNVRTNAVWTSGPEVVGATLSRSGTRLGLVSRAPDGTYAVTVRPLPQGAEQTVWRDKWLPYVRLDDTGSRLAISHAVPNATGEDFQGHSATLWDIDAGKELELKPRPGISLERPHISFRDEGRLLMVQYWNEFDAFYAVGDGTQQYRTERTTTAGEGHYSYWGPGGIFYGRMGAYLGPPDGGLFAWNPRTGAETELGRGTMKGCFIGERLLYRRGLPCRECGSEPGALVTWHYQTGAFQELSSNALHPDCVAGTSQVLFLENWKVPAMEGSGTPPPGSGELVFSDVERGCRQPLAKGVMQYQALGDSVLVRTADSVWRVSYPKPKN